MTASRAWCLSVDMSSGAIAHSALLRLQEHPGMVHGFVRDPHLADITEAPLRYQMRPQETSGPLGSACPCLAVASDGG